MKILYMYSIIMLKMAMSVLLVFLVEHLRLAPLWYWWLLHMNEEL